MPLSTFTERACADLIPPTNCLLRGPTHSLLRRGYDDREPLKNFKNWYDLCTKSLQELGMGVFEGSRSECTGQ